MDITLEPISVVMPVYKPRKLIITIKSPQDELFIRHLIQKMQNFKQAIAAPLLIKLADQTPNKEEEEFLNSLMTTLTSGVK